MNDSDSAVFGILGARGSDRSFWRFVHGDDRAMGIGVIVEVYADRVIIRPRNFARGTMNRKIAIKDDKPYWEQRVN